MIYQNAQMPIGYSTKRPTLMITIHVSLHNNTSCLTHTHLGLPIWSFHTRVWLDYMELERLQWL